MPKLLSHFIISRLLVSNLNLKTNNTLGINSHILSIIFANKHSLDGEIHIVWWPFEMVASVIHVHQIDGTCMVEQSDSTVTHHVIKNVCRSLEWIMWKIILPPSNSSCPSLKVHAY